MVFIGGLVLYLVTVLLGGFVTMQLWGWFAVPILGLPSLALFEALGLSLLIGYLTKSVKPSDKDKKTDKDDFAYGMTVSIVASIITLTMGWIIQLFI